MIVLKIAAMHPLLAIAQSPSKPEMRSTETPEQHDMHPKLEDNWHNNFNILFQFQMKIDMPLRTEASDIRRNNPLINVKKKQFV